MSAAWSMARVDYAQHGRVAQSLSEMGMRPDDLKGKYFEVEDALYRDEQGWYLITRAINASDVEARLYFDFDTDGNRIEWK